MRSKRHDGIEAVLKAENDPSRDRILRTQFWLTTSSPRGELIAIGVSGDGVAFGAPWERHPLTR